MRDVLEKQIKWSKKTFGHGLNTDSILDHMEEEMMEVKNEPYVLEEWIDLVILSMDGAWRCAVAQYPKATVEQLSGIIDTAWKSKNKKNIERKWPALNEQVPGKAVKHIKVS